MENEEKCKILHKCEDDPAKNWEEKAKSNQIKPQSNNEFKPETHIEPSFQTLDNKVGIKQEVTLAVSEKSGSPRLQLNEESNLMSEEPETTVIKQSKRQLATVEESLATYKEPTDGQGIRTNGNEKVKERVGLRKGGNDLIIIINA